MGCFNVACSVSSINIGYNDNVAYIPLEVAKFPYKIGDGNNNLLHPWCFYVPVTLPIFGSYDDYGRIEDIIKDTNVKIIEKHFNCSIEEVLGEGNKIPAPITSGMFVHKDIYDLCIKNQVTEFGTYKGSSFYTRRKLNDIHKKYREELLARQLLVKEYPTLSNDTMSYSEFKFNEFREFNNIYQQEIIKDTLLKELTDFILFSFGMTSVNRFYFPAMCGYQDGNKYSSLALYQKCVDITQKRIEKEQKLEK